MKENTYVREKEVIVTVIGMILILTFYVLYVYNTYIAKTPEIINDFQFLGKAFLILIPVTIVAQILIHIIFFIINKIITDEDVPTINDERDKLIELKTLRISHWIFGLGFVLAMASQAAGMQPFVMFAILFSSCYIGTIVQGLAKIYFYRKGF